MSFELYVPTSAARIKPGRAVLNKDGLFRANVLDFKAVAIEGFCTILVDRELRRVALRRSAEKEPAVRVRARKGGGTAAVDIRGPLMRIGLILSKDKDPPAFNYDVDVEHRFIVLNFGPQEPQPDAQKPRKFFPFPDKKASDKEAPA